MQNPYYSKEQVRDDSLMSPPLTPTEAHHPTLSIEHDDSWYYPRRRKEFITSYSKMVPFLRKRKEHDDSDNHGMFALNVYRDLMLVGQQDNKKSRREIKKEENDCVMSDETVVPHTQKRKLCFTSPSEQDKKKRKRVSSILPTGKEAALAFDSIDIDTPDKDFYPVHWVPLRNALDQVPVKVCWKGAPLLIHQQPYYDGLHRVEASMASILRLSPIQYLRCKRTLILAARTLKLQQIPFTKSVAQKLCRVDVNKTSALWTAFGQLGWFDESQLD
ncbi:hypothetical protein INT47_001924 [Mucor saturninus]|uniref:SWIRM domain-containing protein n=1 Tax=Mucor saturninus TaxID=64648 RepID=A0A8H7RHK3_9FUNG|nr:hypothetical protein INT47_001924 [Mucor saturninus]